MGHRRMFKVELYGRVRRAVLAEGRSQRAVALEFGVSRGSVRKMLRYSVRLAISGSSSEASQVGALDRRNRRHSGRG